MAPVLGGRFALSLDEWFASSEGQKQMLAFRKDCLCRLAVTAQKKSDYLAAAHVVSLPMLTIKGDDQLDPKLVARMRRRRAPRHTGRQPA